MARISKGLLLWILSLPVVTLVQATQDFKDSTSLSEREGNDYPQTTSSSKDGGSGVSEASNVLWTGIRFVEQPPPLVVAERGASLLLNCSVVTQLSQLRYEWRKDGKRLKASGNRVSILKSGSLFIRSVKRRKNKTDEGVYECLAVTRNGTLLSNPSTLVIARGAKDVNVSPSTVTVRVGTTFRLECTTRKQNPPPVVLWEANGRPLTHAKYRIQELASGAVLQVFNAAITDAGEYTCRAGMLDKLTTSQSVTTVQVTSDHTSPTYELFSSPPVVTVVEGSSSAVLECAITNVLQPVYKWKKNDEEVIIGDHFILLGPGNLHIKNVSRADSGTYTCHVTSGTDDTLNVMSTPTTVRVILKPYVIMAPKSLIKDRGHIARFRCIMGGTNYSQSYKPQGVIRWTFNGAQPLASKIFPPVGEPSSSSDLVESNLVQAHAGIYQCWAENAGGVVAAAARLIVKNGDDSPPAPVNVEGEATDPTVIEVTWDISPSSTGVIVAYSVHYRELPDGVEVQQVVQSNHAFIRNLTPYTLYQFFVQAYDNKKGVSLASESIQVRTMQSVPEAPPALTLFPTGPHSLLAQWEPLPPAQARGIIIAYQVWYREKGSPDEILAGELPPDTMELNIVGLAYDSEYEVLVKGGTILGFPSLDDWHWVLGRTGKLDKGPLTLSYTLLNTTSVAFTWSTDISSPPASKYKLTYWAIDDEENTITELKLDSDVQHHVVEAFEQNTWYQVELSLCTDDECKSPVRKVIKTHPKNVTIASVDVGPLSGILPPSRLKGETLSDHSILLSWRRPMGAIEKYVIRYMPIMRQNGIDVPLEKNMQLLECKEELGLLEDLDPFTVYEVSIKSVGKDGNHSKYSAPLRLKTGMGLPTAPRNTKTSLLEAQAVEVHWMEPEMKKGSILRYMVLYTTDLSVPDSMWYYKKVNGSLHMTVLTGLDPHTQYYIKVKAETAAGAGLATEVLNVTTRAYPKYKTTDVDAAAEQRLGIIIGVVIVLCCIVVCIVIIVLRNRCCPPPPAPATAPTRNGRHSPRYCLAPTQNGNGHLPHEETNFSNCNYNPPIHLDTKGPDEENATSNQHHVKATFLPNGKIKTVILQRGVGQGVGVGPQVNGMVPVTVVTSGGRGHHDQPPSSQPGTNPHSSMEDIDPSDTSSSAGGTLNSREGGTLSSRGSGVAPAPRDGTNTVHHRQV